MSNHIITPIILSGGGGTRLWPLSTPENPKQFLRLFDDNSLFQNTVLRFIESSSFTPPLIVCNAKHADITKNQLSDIRVQGARLLLEPAARNTAPAIALAALCCEPEALLLVMPSDHLIGKDHIFLEAVKYATHAAQDGWLVTFGIEPSKPETGYGYIKRGGTLSGHNSCHSVPKFTEKPAIEVAEKMLADGGYLWNAGIFLFRADIYLNALEQYAPDILKAAQKSIMNCNKNADEIRPDKTAFQKSPSDSIDYAIMEKAKKVAVMPVDPDWSDVGSWDNIVRGNNKIIDSKNNLIWSEDIEIQMIGIEDLIVVAHEGKIVILPRGQSQNVKKLSE